MVESLFNLFTDLFSRRVSKCSSVLRETMLQSQAETLTPPLGLAAPENSAFEDVFLLGASDLSQILSWAQGWTSLCTCDILLCVSLHPNFPQ